MQSLKIEILNDGATVLTDVAQNLKRKKKRFGARREIPPFNTQYHKKKLLNVTSWLLQLFAVKWNKVRNINRFSLFILQKSYVKTVIYLKFVLTNHIRKDYFYKHQITSTEYQQQKCLIKTYCDANKIDGINTLVRLQYFS